MFILFQNLRMKHKRQTISKSPGEDGEKPSDGKSSKGSGESGSTSSKTAIGSPAEDKKSCQSCDLMTPLSPLTLSSSSSGNDGNVSTGRGDKHHNNNNNSIKASPNSNTTGNNPNSTIPISATSTAKSKGKSSGSNSGNNNSNAMSGISSVLGNPSDNNNSSYYKDSNSNNSHLLQISQHPLDATGLTTCVPSEENIVVLKTEPMCGSSGSNSISRDQHGAVVVKKSLSSTDLNKISGNSASNNNMGHGLIISPFDSNNPTSLMDTKTPILEKISGSNSAGGHITKQQYKQSCVSGVTPKSRRGKNHHSNNNNPQISSVTSSVPINAGSVMCSYEYANVGPVGSSAMSRYPSSHPQQQHNQMNSKYGISENYMNGVSAITSRFQASSIHGSGGGSGGSSPVAAASLQNHHHQSSSGRSGKNAMNNVADRFGPYGSTNILENTAYCNYTGQSSGGGGGYPQENRDYHHSSGTVNSTGGAGGNVGTSGGYGMGYSTTSDLVGAGGTCRESGIGAAFGPPVVMSTSPNAAAVAAHGYPHYNTFGNSPGSSGASYGSGSQQNQGQSQTQHSVVTPSGGAVGGNSGGNMSSYYHHMVPGTNYPNHQGALQGGDYPSSSSSAPGSNSASSSSPYSSTSNVVPAYGGNGAGDPVDSFFPGQQTSDSGYYDDPTCGYSSHQSHVGNPSSTNFHHGGQQDVAMASGGGSGSVAYAQAYPGYFDASSVHHSENSSSDFNFLTNIANDYAPEYYQLS